MSNKLMSVSLNLSSALLWSFNFIDGKERPVYNSEGNRIAKSEKALRAFYAWLGDSKVVDEQGRPLVVYHGTSAEFDVFDVNKIGKNNFKLGGGFYFTNQQREAKGYGKTFNVYISIKKPISITYESKNITKEQRLALVDYLKNDIKNLRDNLNSSDEMFLHDLYFDISYDVRNNKFNDALKEVLGVDGIVNKVITSKYDNNLYEYVAFSPNQIKSVDNRGTFDINDTNIYHQASAYYPNKVIIDEGVVDLTDAFDSVPTSQEVKSYIKDVIEKGQEFVTLSPEWIIDIPKGKRTRNKILNAGNYKELSKPEFNRHKKYIIALEKLLENARYLKTEPNKKETQKSFVKSYHYFSTFVKMGDRTYYVVFDIEQFKEDKITRPQKIHLYNATEIKIPPISGIGRNYAKREMGGNADTISQSEADVKLEQRAYAGSRVNWTKTGHLLNTLEAGRVCFRYCSIF